ncbi:MAG: sugar ABC transporter permease, partial [Bacteroidales bacterium]|nr:sugar ABC transporter permease [Bacteroidales bacterium]
MKLYSDLEYLKLSKGQKFLYNLRCFFAAIPRWFAKIGIAIGRFFKNLFLGIGRELKDIAMAFVHGDWKTKISYVVMGFGNIARGQILRGLLFLAFEAVFIFYMVTTGVNWLSKLPTLGTVGPHEEYDEILDAYTKMYGDDSFKILLYGVLTIFFIVAFIYTWRMNIKQNQTAEKILATGKPLKSGKDDLRSLVDDSFHKTLLALPLTGILLFTVLPLVFMILVAFTNYSSAHNGGETGLFHWVGLQNFQTLFSWDVGGVNY